MLNAKILDHIHSITKHWVVLKVSAQSILVVSGCKDHFGHIATCPRLDESYELLD